jgi:hypothetical protein
MYTRDCLLTTWSHDYRSTHTLLHREGGCHEVLNGVTGMLLGRGIEEGIAKGRDGEEGDGEAGCTP